MEKQMELFSEGGLRDEGGTVEPESGNEVPSGSLQKEVADDIPIMISEGEFVFPADVVRYIGLNTLMKMRQDAKQGLKMMEKMGQMGNPEEAELPDDIPFGMADLIVIGAEEDKEDKKEEDDVKEMQTGGLLDDPRFQRPTGGQTPTIGDENKKEIEDALLGTVYGTITMRRYVNADGMVKYIPFIGDEPQMAIPEGFELDESAPKPTNTTVTSISQDSDSGDSTATSYNELNPNLNPFKDQASVNFDINNLDPNQLVDYYGSFSSPMNRFLSVGVGALFGGLPALGIATMQQFAQTKGPNSLKATEDKLAQMVKNGEISGDLLDKLKAFQKRAKEKGTGPRSFLSRLIGGASGGDKKKADTLTKAVQAGDVNTVDKESQGAEQNVQEALDDAIRGISDDISLSEPEAQLQDSSVINTTIGLFSGAGPTPTFTTTMDKQIFMEKEQGPTTSQLFDDFVAPSEVGPPELPELPTTAEREKVDVMQAMSDPRRQITPETTQDTLRRVAGGNLFKTAFGLEGFDTARSSPYEAEGRSQLGSGFKSPEEARLDMMRRGRGRTKEQEQEEQKQTKKRTRRAVPKTGILPRRGERFTDVGLDRPSKFGQTRIDDFLLGVQRDDKGDITNLTEQQQKNIRQNVQEQENIRQKLDQEDRVRQERGFGPMSVQERFDRQQQEFTGFDSQGNFLGAKGGLFYVGGVPTKPMKPQRLKKGGLAKPKVKPKRMKKGGLASKKK